MVDLDRTGLAREPCLRQGYSHMRSVDRRTIPDYFRSVL